MVGTGGKVAAAEVGQGWGYMGAAAVGAHQGEEAAQAEGSAGVQGQGACVAGGLGAQGGWNACVVHLGSGSEGALLGGVAWGRGWATRGSCWAEDH